jgi:hypothetical protein
MRKIGLLLVAGLMTMLVGVGASPAHADFHGFCTGPANAYMGLAQQGSNLAYSGTVDCPGATAIDITSTLTATVPAGTPYQAVASCTSSCDHVSAGGSTPSAPGIYELTMVFSVSTPLGTATNHSRYQRYLVPGQGKPTLICSAANKPSCP